MTNLSCFARAWRVLLPLVLAVCFMQGAGAAPVFPIKVGSDQRHLVDQNNVPFMINGDAAWSLIAELQPAEVTQYLKDRWIKGFNTVLVNLIEKKFSTNAPRNINNVAPFANMAPVNFVLNETYFANADFVINEAAKYGMLVLLEPAYLGYTCGSEGWCQDVVTSYNSDGGTALFNYGVALGNRYKTFKNILWVNGGDTWASDPSNPPNTLAAVQKIIDGIKSVDSAHVHSAHCNRSDDPSGKSSALDCYDLPWLDVNTTYSQCTQTPARTQIDYSRSRVMPFLFFEGFYENENSSTPQCLRAQAYWSILGGSTGHVFGNHPIWHFSGPGVFSNGGLTWQGELNSVGAKGTSRVGALFRSRAWHLLVPDYANAVVTAGRGNISNATYVAAARASDGSSVIAYLPTQAQVTVDMTKVAGSNAKAWWFNPASGASSLIGTFATTGSQNFTPPSSGDWVLVLDNAGLGLPAPGAGAKRADFNGDGKSDMFFRNTATSATIVWQMNGASPSFLGLQAVSDTNWQVQGIGDFNGDGKADVFWRNTSTGSTILWLMNDAGIGDSLSTATAGSTWQLLGIGDFNGDGKADMLWRNATTGATIVWQMDGASPSFAELQVVSDTNWQVQAIGDFDGDGKADIFWRNTATGATIVWLMNGTGIGSSVSSVTAGSTWQLLGVGDFNGDGKADLFWRNTSTGATILWQMNGAIPTFLAVQSVSDTNWQVHGIGDYNGDGKADVFWRNTSTGATIVWLMNGASITSSLGSVTASSATWLVQNPQ